MWNDTDTPIAFLITFRCYGTWLHGDDRGFVDRRNNIYGTPRIPENSAWQKVNSEILNADPISLSAWQRRSVEKAIKETCIIRNWILFALNVRTNHVHAVVQAIGTNSSKVLHALKSNSTRQMRLDGCWTEGHSPWSARGSKRMLWNEKSVNSAIDYVLYGQGDELPDFD